MRCEFERRRMAHPARQRLPEALGMPRMRPHESGRAGAAVEVLVAAADGEVGIGALQIHRQRAGRMREVPDRQHAGGMRLRGERGHVVQAAGAVVHLREHQHRDAFVEQALDFVGLAQHQLAAALAREALGDVEVGGEVRALRDDHAALRCVGLRDRQRGTQHLEQVHRGRVGHHQFAGLGAHEACDLVAHALRQRDPAGAVPAADQVRAPFITHHLLHALRCRLRHHAQRVAVEVDHTRRQRELLTQRAQAVLRVEREAVVSGRHASSLSTARTGDASALISFSGNAISS